MRYVRVCQHPRLPDCPSIYAAFLPTVAKGTDWESVYNEENDKQSVLATVDEAVAWANELIGRIDEAE